MIDYLVIGQGISGTLVSWHLLQGGATVMVVDQFQKDSPSQVAGGAINPITGRRVTKTWNAEVLLPESEIVYRKLEALLNIRCYHPSDILKIYPDTDTRTRWETRMSDPAYQPYMDRIENTAPFQPHFQCEEGMLFIKKGSYVNLRLLTASYRSWLKEKGNLCEDNFNINDLSHSEGSIEWKGITARNIVFCEGPYARHNSLFNWLPLRADKGECLIINVPGLQADRMTHKFGMILPYENGSFWAGASNEMNNDDPTPTLHAREALEMKLKNTLRIKFNIIEHNAAIRPTVKDRRPLIGSHPTLRGVHIFNGMGTKGTSLAPYHSRLFARALINGSRFDEETDIKRYYSDFQRE